MKNALFEMASEKAPGPDGYSAAFYKQCWNEVGEDVLDAMNDFFCSGKLHPSVNSTILTLIPKKPNATSMRDYIPISCCNTIYKALSKVLANRICSVLPSLVGYSQSAFIKGRMISDNVILAHELLSRYSQKTVSPRCALKIDLMKAFDSVEWGYIGDMLVAMGFPGRYIRWIMVCFNSTRFSVNLNGSLFGYFPAKRGLRQGDPISPYLFVIAMQGLDYLFSEAAANNLFQYHPQCKNIKLTHICFADDLLVFTKANVTAITQVTVIMDLFHQASGLQLNPDKSDLYMAGVNRTIAGQIAAVAEFREGQLPMKYLGIPISAGKLSKADCRGLVDKITGRVKDWKAKFLNYAGRLELIKLVIHGILQYWLSMFILPKTVLKEIEAICASFLWGKKEGQRIKIAWYHMAFPLSEGGLGLKDLSSWNEANILRHLWNLITRGGSLWVAWILKYRLKQGDIWTLTTATGSWHWRSILKLRETAALYISVNAAGECLWNGEYMPKFKASKVWENIRPRRGEEEWFKYLWKNSRIMKNSLLTWLIIRNRITTLDKIAKWDTTVVAICPLCSTATESRDHLFAGCSFFRSCFNSFFSTIQFNTWTDHLDYVMREWKGESVENKVKRISWCAVLGAVWRERCKRVFGANKRTSSMVAADIKLDLTLFFTGHRDETSALRWLRR
ncbi:LINE-1 retrotransposable element ORF2 protein [Linum perenne]